MLNLAEYRKHPASLADFLPWAALVAEGVVLNKDGSFQRTARFRGPDLDSATPAELVGVTARLNNALRRLGSGWAIFVEAQRIAAKTYPRSSFPDAASALVDLERQDAFEEAGAHFESRYFLTFVWLPPAEDASRIEGFLYEGRAQTGVDPWELLRGFVDRTNRVLQLVEGFMPEVGWLDDGETLTYLHSTVSTRQQRVRVPETPMHLDVLLADESLTGGLEPRLGAHHLRTLTVVGFPTVTHPGILDELNRLAFPYRWSTRAILIDKTEAVKLLTKIRRQWFAKRKSIAAILKEVMTNEASTLVDSDAANKAADADLALAGARLRRCRRGLCHGDRHRLGRIRADRRRKAPPRREGDPGARFHLHAGRGECDRGLAREPSGPRLRQCPPAAGLDVESGAYDPALGGLGRAGEGRALQGAAAFHRQDRGLDAVPFLAPCRRCRPHLDRGADRRRQVRAAGADGDAVPSLSGQPDLRLRFRRIDPHGGARLWRRLA